MQNSQSSGDKNKNNQSQFKTGMDNIRKKANQGAGQSVKRMFGGRRVLPIALGAFAVGIAVGVMATIYLPVIRKSKFVANLGNKFGATKDQISEGLKSAKEKIGLNKKGATEQKDSTQPYQSGNLTSAV